MSDSSIAKKLNISSQAVGKIRRKLEEGYIQSYTTNLNYAKLGIQTFAVALAKITSEGLDLGELELEQKLLHNPHSIHVYRLPSQNITHIIIYGFRDTEELDRFFHSPIHKADLHQYLEHKEMHIFSYHSLIKANPNTLFQKIINEYEQEPSPERRVLGRINTKWGKGNTQRVFVHPQ